MSGSARKSNFIVGIFNHRFLAIDNMEKDQIIYDKRKAMGESIRAMRTAQGWEQEQLAEIAGISVANVRSVEAGKYAVNIDVLNKIAGALNAELRIVEL